MAWIIYGATCLEMLMNKFKSTLNKYDIQSILAPISWCFDTYPILSVVTICMILAYAVPICFFLLFAVVTFLITFAGFLFIEGTIIAIAFFLLLSVLSTLTIILALFSFTCWTIYVIIAQVCQALSINSVPNVPRNEPLLNNNHINHSFHVHEE